MRTTNLRGNPVSLAGESLSPGQDAPDFKLQLADMSDYTLATDAGKTRILAAYPSLDTPVCDAEVRRFNQEATGIPDTVIVGVSMDLPFAAKRWCAAAGVENVRTASDHRDAGFGNAYGCLINEGPLARVHSRAIFVIGPDDKLKHVEYVPEVGEEPDYATALAAARG